MMSTIINLSLILLLCESFLPTCVGYSIQTGEGQLDGKQFADNFNGAEEQSIRRFSSDFNKPINHSKDGPGKISPFNDTFAWT